MRGSHVMQAASDMFGRMMAERRRRHTKRILENLPDYIRKDIGWSAEAAAAWLNLPIDPSMKNRIDHTFPA